MPNAQLDGRRVFYDEAGEGEPLLLVQGMSGTRLSWGDPFLAALHKAGFATVAYDHRGVGRSDPIDLAAPLTIADLAEDAAALLDAVGLESAHVLGVSMGGMVAQELALRHPERIRTLTLGCTYAGGPGSALTDAQIVQRLASLFMAGRVGEAMKEGFTYNVSTAYAADPANLETFKRIASELPASLEVLFAQFQAVQGHDTSARLSEIGAPTLVLHGSDDQILPVANAHAIASAIPGARLEILDGVGHLFWWERPERAAELLGEHAGARQAAAQ
jgi:pimeloyl-ACP methyl ester carboxylesterase